MKLLNYTELEARSNFSFLHGASHPEEYVERASELGYSGIAITDTNSLAGIIRAYEQAKKSGIPFYAGSRVIVRAELYNSKSASLEILAYPRSAAGYANLSSLLTTGKRRAEKGHCFLALEDLLSLCSDLVLIVVPPRCPDPSKEQLLFLRSSLQLLSELKESVFISISKNYQAKTTEYEELCLLTAKQFDLPLVATSAALYHLKERRALADVLNCIRNGCTLQQAGFLLTQNAERYLKPLAEVNRLFRRMPEAIHSTMRIAEMLAGFSISQLKYEYPREVCPQGVSAQERLAELTWKGAKQRYPWGVPQRVRSTIEEELELINELHYEKYFLTCHDIVSFARSKNILCQGRGAAANSAVCYCLGITSVDPAKIDLLFARFVSKERDEPPDIDIDFEHERREEVIQYIYQKYGRERAALVCEVVTFRFKSALRETAKVFGLPLATIDQLSKATHGWLSYKIAKDDFCAIGINPDDPTMRLVLQLTSELRGFPRHLSQHVGGFIISDQPLHNLVPILNATMPNRTIIEWDKNDIEALGMLKIDLLALGMLTCIRKALALINQQQIKQRRTAYQLHNIPAEDPVVYQMICKADTIGVFQIESRAQMSMLPRLRPRCFYDLVIEVAIVRPGPIQGNMIHPFLKRRNSGREIKYPDKEVQEILGKTLGVPIFQEQAMRLAIVLAGFSPGEAEQLRRAMGAWKRNRGLIAKFQSRIMAGMLSKGYSSQFAESCVKQIRGFSEYGFPESHAASFALLVYASAWIKCHYPALFACALLNSQPMGFYAPSQIVRDAREHGVPILPVCIVNSLFDCSIEGKNNISRLRLGFRLVRGIKKSQIEIVLKSRASFGPPCSIQNLWNNLTLVNGSIEKRTLYNLAKADAFASLGISRREAFWQIRALAKSVLPLDRFNNAKNSETPKLKKATRQLSMFEDYASMALSLRAHPLEFAREALRLQGVATAKELRLEKNYKDNARSAGLVICRQRPGTGKGVVFLTLEDETGVTNAFVRSQIFERFSQEIICSSAVMVCGRLERNSELVYINANYIQSIDPLIGAGSFKRAPGSY